MSRPWWLPLLPARHRARYADELVDLLEHSDRPVRDAADVVRRAMIWNLEEIVNRPWLVSAAVVAALSLFALGYATAQLADGLAELPRHWWSAAPIAGLGLAAVLALADRRPTPGPRRKA